VFAISLISFVCLVAIGAVLVAAIDPMARRGSSIVAGMGDAVGSAIARANEAAERNAQAHYRARDEYLQRRGLRRIDGALHTAEAPPPAVAVGAPGADLDSPLLRGGADDALGVVLQRWEALRDVDVDDREVVNAETVRQDFPEWLAARLPNAPWNEKLVLRDVVLVVSRLAADHRRQQENAYGQHDRSHRTPAGLLVRASAADEVPSGASSTVDASARASSHTADAV
jgi:hypothetical protein